MGATLGVTTLGTEVDQSGLKKGLNDSEKTTKSKLKSVANAIGTGFGIAIGQNIIRFVGMALKGIFMQISQTFKDLTRIERISAQTEAVIKSTGQAAGFTTEEIENMAGAMEDLTASEAEAVQEGANMLLTFTNIGKEVFPEALAVVNDMSVALGQDMTQVSVQVGKALNDPILGISALSRVGVNFTKEQKDVIAALVKTGQTAEAQKIILAELNVEFGGSAEAFAATIEGQTALAEHQLGTLKETVVGAFLPLIGQAVSGLNTFLRSEAVTGAVDDFTAFLTEDVIPVITSVFEAIRTIITGDFRGGIFGLTEDSVGIDTLFKFRETFMAVGNWIIENGPAIQGALAGIFAVLLAPKVLSAISMLKTVVLPILSSISLPLVALIAIAAALGAAWTTDFMGMRTAVTEFWETTVKPVIGKLIEWLQVKIPLAIDALALFWETVLLPAIMNVWVWVQDNVFPIVSQLIEWLQVNIPLAIQALALFWENVFLPAIASAWEWIETNVFPIIEALVDVLFPLIEHVVGIVADVFENTLLPILQDVWGWVQENAMPIIESLVDWLGEVLPPIVEDLAAFFQDTLLPAIENFGAFLEEHIFPLLTEIGNFMTAVFNVAFEALSNLITNTIIPALSNLWDWLSDVFTMLAEKLGPTVEIVGGFLQDIFAAALEGVKTAIDGVTDGLSWLTNLLNGLGGATPPDWTTGSPMPIQIGFEGVAESVLKVGKALPKIGLGFDEIGPVEPQRFTNQTAQLASGQAAGKQEITIKVDTFIGMQEWLDKLAAELRPSLDRVDIRTSRSVA